MSKERNKKNHEVLNGIYFMCTKKFRRGKSQGALLLLGPDNSNGRAVKRDMLWLLRNTISANFSVWDTSRNMGGY